jgi:Mg-chelatase subunit ChlD
MGPTNELEVSAPTTTALAELSALSENAMPLSGLEGSGLGGGREGEGSGAKAATEFFGIGGYGQTFVYVVDASDSMNDYRKFERARYELLHSLEQLASDQRYYVIFYNDGAYPMDADEPVLATQDQFARTTRWVQSIEPTGGTNPLPALLHALSLRPDAVFFLSDGQFDPLTIQLLRSRNRPNRKLDQRQIPIHTIAFHDRFAEWLMRSIARNSGGEYRFER